MRKALPGLLLLVLPGLMAAQDSNNCQHVGGTISTNFVSSTMTFGSATGDLAGGIGVKVLSVTPSPNGNVVFHNQHSWVTATGDTIFTQAADVTAFPTAVAGFYAASYLKGVVVTGGTGRFQNAHGQLAGWGAVDTNKSEIVLRYEGQLCFGKGEE